MMHKIFLLSSTHASAMNSNLNIFWEELTSTSPPDGYSNRTDSLWRRLSNSVWLGYDGRSQSKSLGLGGSPVKTCILTQLWAELKWDPNKLCDLLLLPHSSLHHHSHAELTCMAQVGFHPGPTNKEEFNVSKPPGNTDQVTVSRCLRTFGLAFLCPSSLPGSLTCTRGACLVVGVSPLTPVSF